MYQLSSGQSHQVKENLNRTKIEQDSLNLIDSSAQIIFKKYVQPVITDQCNHSKMCYNLEDARKELQQNGQFICKSPGCNARITSESQLIKDIRWYAEEEFHELVQDIMVIDGQLFNKYYRGKRHTDFFQQKEIREQIISLIKRFVPRECSINSLIMSNLQSTSGPSRQQSTNKTGRNIRITFWAICLLDKVKLTIPVRIIGCKHIECYDITSLLAYQKEHANDDEKIFYCLQPGCEQKLDITTMQSMLSQLVIDVDLLAAIKFSPPSTIKFQFNEHSMNIEYDVFRDGGVIVDKVILECYKKLKGNTNVTANSKEYQEFERSVQQFVIAILQQGIPQDIEKKLNLQKYRVMDIDMRDSLTGFPIEYPVRCKHSDDFKKCNDLRSIVASFVYEKKANQMTPYICKICQQDQKTFLVKVQIYSQLYIDQNLFSYMFKDMSFIHTNVFKYDGKSYMRQEFYDRQKIGKQEYINELKKGTPTPTNLVVEFKQLFCSMNPKQRLTMPLRLRYCRKNSIVDFETFYSELEKVGFELGKGITLCNCQLCNNNPMTKIQGYLYYHEAFGIALTEFRKQNNQSYYLRYDFEKMKIADLNSPKNFNKYRKREGKALLQKKFQGKYKLSKEEFLQNNRTQTIVVRSQHCDLQSEIELKIPLILLKCEYKGIIDFETFYNALRTINFDLSNQGLIFCECEYCVANPIKNIKGRLAYHEAYAIALTQYRKKVLTYSYNFMTEEIIIKQETKQFVFQQ